MSLGEPPWWHPFRVEPTNFNPIDFDLHPSPAPTPPPDPILVKLESLERRLKSIEDMLK